MNAKYVTIEYPEPLGVEAIFIFPECIEHRAFVQRNAHAGCKIVGAGFIRQIGSGFHSQGKSEFLCYGRSESLNISSRSKEDSALANQL